MKVVRNNRTKKKELLIDETIFSIANGYIGTRGSFTEGYGTDYEFNQTYMNGFYNAYDYTYEENLPGFPQKGEKFVNLYDGTRIDFVVDGIPINLSSANLIALERTYYLDKGYTYRKAHYKKNEYDFVIHERKLVHHKFKGVITIDIQLESNYVGPMKILSYLKESKKTIKEKDPRVSLNQSSHIKVMNIDLKTPLIEFVTSESNLHLCSSVAHNLNFIFTNTKDGIRGEHHLDFETSIQVTKHIIHTSDLYDNDYIMLNKELNNKFSSTLPIELYLKTEEEYSTLFWNDSMIKLYDNSYYEALLNYNIYQLNRQGGEHEKHSIAAKGLSGEGYEGHYFWDTEIYMIPFFILTNPDKAKKLLMYRYEKIEEARMEAQLLGYQRGIKIPWRTISGRETSPYYPAGSAQFHINSDIAYTIIKYVEATKDIEFLVDAGFEMLVETARFLIEATNFNQGYYHLNSVTGPDEYTTVVDDNCYTNQMLQYHLNKTIAFYKTYFGDLKHVLERLEFTTAELEKMKQIASNLYIPFDDKLNVFQQDKNFFMKQKLDLRKIPKENFPLLLHYHPLFLYKHQVLKQADILLSLVLLDYDNHEVLKNTFEYYEPITTHDSSLSKCIYSIVAFQLGLVEKASRFLKDVFETDYENTHNNTEHGLHVANLGGSYLGFIYGINGIRFHNDYITLSPRKNTLSSDYEFHLKFHNQRIQIRVKDKIYIKTSGKVTFKVYDEIIHVNDNYECNLKYKNDFN